MKIITYNSLKRIHEKIVDLLEKKVDKEKGKKLSSNDYTDEEKEKLANLNNYDDNEIKEDISNIKQNKAEKTEVAEISKKIPTQASEINQLADKDFVNSSIATNTATFRGNFNSLEELNQAEADINDYANIIETDGEGNIFYNRYTYSGTEWIFNFRINTTTFTSAQWKAINSNATAELMEKLVGIEEGANKTTKTSQLENDSGFVKNTDYAKNTQAGVVKIGGSGLLIRANGIVCISKALANNIVIKNGDYAPLVPSQIDLLTKVGITTNEIELTQEEKINAMNWLGVIEYYKGLETISKQQNDRITALEELLSTTATSAMLLDNLQSDLESEV